LLENQNASQEILFCRSIPSPPNPAAPQLPVSRNPACVTKAGTNCSGENVATILIGVGVSPWLTLAIGGRLLGGEMKKGQGREGIPKCEIRARIVPGLAIRRSRFRNYVQKCPIYGHNFPGLFTQAVLRQSGR
jgi:hypothetical protein